MLLFIFIFTSLLFVTFAILLHRDNEKKRKDKTRTIYSVYDDDDTYPVACIMSGIFAALSCIFVIACALALPNEKSINEKIKVYEEENIKIECAIDKIIAQYMTHEQYILPELENAKLPQDLTIVSVLPLFSKIETISDVQIQQEIKADKFVQQQLDLYIQHNRDIISLKEKRADIPRLKWLLYFGK